jgi:hypothetical protein
MKFYMFLFLILNVLLILIPSIYNVPCKCALIKTTQGEW